jgi:hypothetical protein
VNAPKDADAPSESASVAGTDPATPATVLVEFAGDALTTTCAVTELAATGRLSAVLLALATAVLTYVPALVDGCGTLAPRAAWRSGGDVAPS